MKKAPQLLAIFLFISSLLLSCGAEQKQMKNDIRKLQNNLYNESNNFDESVAKQLVSSYSAYAEKFPKDTLSVKFLFNAAQLSENLGNYNQSISLFKKVYENYPDSDKSPVALFMMGFVSDNMKQYKNAVAYLNKFRGEFPDHHLSNDAKFLLQNMGVPADQLFEINVLPTDSLSNS